MIHTVEIDEICTECFTYRLVTEANTEDRLAGRVSPDQRQKQAGLLRYTRTRGKNNAVVCFNFLERYFIIAPHFDRLTQDLFHQVDEVIGKRIVIIENKNLHF